MKSIPPIELTRLSGLKEAHARFDEVSKKLNIAYVTARRRNDMATTSAVASVWAEMCADNLLCKKLLQCGMLSDVFASTARSSSFDRHSRSYS